MATTPLAQAVMAGMDPAIYGSLSNIQRGDALTQQGIDGSPTNKWGAIGRLAQTLAGSYLSNSANSDLAKTIAGGKKSAQDDLLAAITRSSAIPSAPPASAPMRALPPSAATAPPQPAAPVEPEPGSPNAMVANRFPAEWSPGTAASPLPADAPSPLDTAAYPAGPAGAPVETAVAANQPRGIRNNNPLNIEAGDFTKGQPGFSGSDGRFAKFETPEHGVAAADKLLDIYEQKHGLNTVAGIVGRWAPKADGNDTMAYAASVAGRLGLDPNAPVPKEMRSQLIAAMAQHENGKAAPGTSQTPYQVAGPAVAAPQSAAGEDDALPANATAAQGPLPTQPAAGFDPHRLLAVLQNPYSDDATKALASKLLATHLAPSEDTYGVTGEGPFGDKKYGFINTKEHTINGQPADRGGAASASGPMDGIDSSMSGDAYLAQFPPEIQTGVKDYIEGRRMPTGNPRRNDIIRQIASKYGNDIGVSADDASFGARRTMLNDLQKTTAGSMGGQITSLRTAANHLASMAADAENLGNWDLGISWLSKGANTIGGLRTDQAAKMEKLKNDALRYGQEITKFYAGSPGGESERQHFISALDSAKSPKELAAVIEAERQLIPGRGEELQNRINSTLGPKLADKYKVHSHESENSIKEAGNTVKRMRGDPDAPPKPGSKPSPDKPAAAAPKAISSKSEYDALPSGSSYIAPDGSLRTKK